jgi:radical SAM superfamily enzyme YgiQ (UPF0313 family)
VQNLIKQLITGNRSPKEMEKIKGICFLNENNEMIFTGYEKPLPAPLVERPDFTILEEDKSINHFISSATFKSYDIKNQKPKKSTIVIVAKGCVARCTFCHRFEKGYRVSPNESIINHIKFLRDKYGIGHVGIGDENFGSYKEETLDLIKKIHSLGLTWHAGGVRAHTISYETLKKWKEYGCSSVMFGIESGSPRMLKVMEKKITLEQNIAALKDVYDAKLLTVIQLVIGMPGETDETINETIDFLIKTMPYYPDPFRKHIDYLLSVNYAQSLPGTPLYEYARDNGFIGKDIDSEEKYLLDISDKDAYDNDHYINFSHQPLLKVYTWRHMINWKVWRHYALNYLNFNFKKHQIIWGILCFYFNKKLNLKLNSSLLKAFSNFENQNQNIDTHDYNFAKSIRIVEMFKLLLPWNNLTYPLLCIVVAWKESQNLNWFFKLLFDHIKWSMKKNDLSKLPDITLRKITSISDLDQTVELRKGR